MFETLKTANDPFFIAEVGQNHNGCVERALEFIDIFSRAGATAIKFQTRDNKILFDSAAYNKNYESENSYGKTYGEHREHLELKKADYERLLERCRQCGVYFMSTPFDQPSLEFLLEVGVDILKVASFDLGNLPFLKLMAKSGKPIVISTGGGNQIHIQNSISEMSKYSKNIAILHCVSQYPCPAEKMNLNKIKDLIKVFPNYSIGSSDHFNGTLSGPIAYTLGARVFEKHVTLNRSEKGTDQSFSLEKKGFEDFVRDVKRTPQMCMLNDDPELGNEPVFKKLGKSLVAAADITAGEVIQIDNLSGKIFNEVVVPVRESYKFIGNKLRNDIKKGDALTFDMLKE